MAGFNFCSLPNVEYSNQPTASNWKNILFLLLFFCCIFYIICVLILSSVPPVSRDALIHHLSIPKMYLSNGGMYEIPSMHFSYFPMNLDLLYLLPLYFENDIAPKYIHFFFALLTAGFIFKYLKDILNPIYGLIGAFFFLSIPIIVKLSVTVYVDLGLIFFSWACLYYFLRWYDTGFTLRNLILAGISCGLALGTKYNGLILLLIIVTFVPIAYSLKNNAGLAKAEFWQRNKNSLKGLQWGAVFLLISLIIFSPWMIRNAIWKQNPVYPLFNSVFNPPAAVEEDTRTKEKSPPRNAFWVRKYVYQESFIQTLLIPIRAFFQGQDDNPKYFDGKLNPCLLFFLLISFLGLGEKKLRHHRNFLFFFAILFILFVFFFRDFRIRYMAPAIPPLVVLSVFGIRNLLLFASRLNRPAKRLGCGITIVLISFGFVYNGKYIYEQFSYIRPLEYLSKKISRDAYISRYRQEYPVIAYANKILPENARVLCLSIGDRTYYVDRPVHLAEDFYMRKNGRFSENELLKKIKRYGTTHIIFHKTSYLNWARFLNREEREGFQKVFQNHTRQLYKKNNYLLLEFQDNLSISSQSFREGYSEEYKENPPFTA